MRLLLNLLLIVLTAAGPSVCCCTPAAIANAATRLVRLTALHPKQKSAWVCCNSTPHRKPDRSPPDKGRPTTAGTTLPGQAPDDHPCPCQEPGRRAVVMVVNEGDPRVNPDSRDLFSPGSLPVSPLLPPGFHPGGAEVAALAGPRLPFMSVDDRLFAHHALRC